MKTSVHEGSYSFCNNPFTIYIHLVNQGHNFYFIIIMQPQRLAVQLAQQLSFSVLFIYHSSFVRSLQGKCNSHGSDWLHQSLDEQFSKSLPCDLMSTVAKECCVSFCCGYVVKFLYLFRNFVCVWYSSTATHLLSSLSPLLLFSLSLSHISQVFIQNGI